MATLSRGALYTPLCDLLGIRYPVCQAGMAFVARSALVAAVSEAGGLGVLAAAHCTPAELRAEIRRVRDLTDRPFGVDILFATVRGAGTEVEQFTDSVRGWVDVSLDERVPVIVAGLGSPGPLTAEAHRLGIKVMALCGNVKQARDHARSGVDVVIAQGHEAGGHTGRVTGMVLVPAVVDAVAPVPVLAAGGIADGRGLVAALALGAIDEEGTVVSRASSGKPCRLILNNFTRSWEGREAEIQPFPSSSSGWASRRASAPASRATSRTAARRAGRAPGSSATCARPATS